ncbi:carbohydrate ABC transporter permease [Cohnella zeiphila]|uniref:Carbohydrate ABC transporter permease n=1 Tax=Cohnella zeiphila TaxID=2761120 RepID=A0A7X0SR45_9BACL|nr:carbohydrate ABC transporter permease [Cohnella zeiphila]MBB6734608.1 carbohydrate ABC transporter permease [Cohnella zeiphila]
MKLTLSKGRVIVHFVYAIISAAMLIPFLLVVSISISDDDLLNKDGYKWIPEKINLLGYQVMLKASSALVRAYGVTIVVTVIGTLLGLLLTTMLAYTISRRDFRYRGPVTFYIFFSMLFQAGIVPLYILMTQYLHLRNTIWALILPLLINPFYVMIMRGFLAKIPGEIIESVKMDGASEWRIFAQIVLPLSKPALVTIGLMLAFGYWNDWFYGLLLIDEQKLVPLQLLLYRNINAIEFLKGNPAVQRLGVDYSHLPTLSARMAMTILAAGPMMIVFPFFQKYFVSGLTVGALKE